MVDQKVLLQSIGAHETGNHFRPVNCLEKDLKQKKAVAGFLYFTKDSHKIYQGLANGEYQMVGGSSSIFYGNRPMTDDEKYGNNPYFVFAYPDHIEGENIPAVDSLILNLPDGGFYRVLSVEGNSISVQRLAMAGGGGSASGGTTVGSLVIDFYNGQAIDDYVTILSGTEHYIEFNITAKDAAGDTLTESGTANWSINGKTYTQRVTTGYNKFRVDEYLVASDNFNTINLVVYMNTGGLTETPASKTWHIKVVDLRLEWNWNYSKDEYRTGETFTLTFTPYGSVDCKAYISFDNGSTLNKDYFIEDIPSYKTGTAYTTKSMNSLEYGEHTCTIYLETTINPDSANPITKATEAITHKVTFTNGGSSTILTVPFFQKSATQYDTIKIPFLVYDPDVENCDVSFYVNDTYVTSQTYNRDLQYWPYTITTYGTLKLTLQTTNGDSKREFTVIVNQLDLNREEVDGAAFNLKAINFSSNEEIRNWKDGNVSLKFSDNFDWRNGGLKFDTLADGSIEKYICIRQGTWMEIDYKLFEKFTAGASGGKNFKICFKASNCYDYEAPVLSCINYNYNEVELTEDTYVAGQYYILNDSDEYTLSREAFNVDATYYNKVRENEIGLEMDAQKAIFASAAYPNFASQYCENSYIEFEAEIWPKVEDKTLGSKTVYADRYLMIWIDGVPAGAKPYTMNMALTQVNPQTIHIGSDECDVYVYTAKAYERQLSFNEHLDNFVMDAPSINKMLDRHRRNDILGSNGDISYEKLVAANPGCHAYLYDIPRLTTTKDDKVDGCTYYELVDEYQTLDKPFMRAEKVRTYVQGTSSAAYGVAAFNLRSDFTKKGQVYDKDDNMLPGWYISSGDLPIDIACTKVNVASCENANNVVNAEWYNQFQPYWDAHRRKGYAIDSDGNILYNPYRDCMKFHSGVVFLRDHNTSFDYLDENGDPKSDIYLASNAFINPDNTQWQEDYKKEPYFKMYSIGNMGNDKKNLNVFHDITNPRAACVEVADNQNAEHWMTVANEEAFIKKVIGYDEKGKEITEGPYYEFRYGVAENDDMKDNEQGITEESQREDFMRFVRWLAANDPHPYEADTHPNGYTGEELETPVTFENDFIFQGFDPPGYEGKTNPTGISLKGQKITKYKKTYTHDTKEYRIAKMLYECENYMVMDSVVFHYLYITRHTMVDNVAKNTFWSTEDGLHWDLTKNYDNDTSDGNDNTGNLTYTYGLEYGDINPNGKDVFNATPSVWIAFVSELNDAQQYLFQELEKKGAWRASSYLAEFKKHQDIIPEICWIRDYERKYIRPRRLGLDETTFLNRLEGGRKTHQRNQFETYQEFYMNSKYVAGTTFSDSAGIEFRFNNNPDEAWDRNNVLPITFYIDCYGTTHVGGQKRTSNRIKRGQYYNAPVGELISVPSDSTCYIYGASMIQTMKGLAKLYPGYAKMTNASKLREFEIGSSEEGYYNARLFDISIGTNAMLQKLQARNCGDPDNITSLVLENASQLQQLQLAGSAFKEVSLAPNATTRELELNPLNILSATNLLNLETVNLDNGIYSSISQAYINNCPMLNEHTYKFAKAPQLTRYQFTDVAWTIDGTTDDDFITNTSGEVIALAALENLTDNNTGVKDGTSTATALTGKIIIDTSCNIDEYEIYKKYAQTYPNLLIEYTDNVGTGLNKAVELMFWTTKESQEQYYRVLGSGDADGDTIAVLISANGPLGIAMETPHKESTAAENFAFTGYWIHEVDGVQTKYYNPNDFEEGSAIENGAISFANIAPTENMIFYPEYITSPRQYKVQFRDWEGNIILQDGEEEYLVNYGELYDGPMENFHYRDSSALDIHLRWAFQGWSKTQYKDVAVKDPKYEDLASLVVTNDITLHGHYLKENCREVASKTEYFYFNGTQISIADEYRSILQGKITLPSKYNDVNLTVVRDFKDLTGVTHIFFLNGNTTYTDIYDSAFLRAQVLQYVELPAGIVNINDQAFQGIKTLTDISLGNNIKKIGSTAFSNINVDFKALPSSLETIGTGAFMLNDKISISAIPNSVKSIGNLAFNYCPKLNISYFGGTDSKLESIGKEAFKDSGKESTVSNIFIGSSVNVIGIDAFLSYGKDSGGKITDLYFAKANSTEYYQTTDKISSHSDISSMGFTNSYNVTWNYSGEGGI